jgi:hypothetical protein
MRKFEFINCGAEYAFPQDSEYCIMEIHKKMRNLDLEIGYVNVTDLLDGLKTRLIEIRSELESDLGIKELKSKAERDPEPVTLEQMLESFESEDTEEPESEQIQKQFDTVKQAMFDNTFVISDSLAKEVAKFFNRRRFGHFSPLFDFANMQFTDETLLFMNLFVSNFKRQTRGSTPIFIANVAEPEVCQFVLISQQLEEIGFKRRLEDSDHDMDL